MLASIWARFGAILRATRDAIWVRRPHEADSPQPTSAQSLLENGGLFMVALAHLDHQFLCLLAQVRKGLASTTADEQLWMHLYHQRWGQLIGFVSASAKTLFRRRFCAELKPCTVYRKPVVDESHCKKGEEVTFFLTVVLRKGPEFVDAEYDGRWVGKQAKKKPHGWDHGYEEHDLSDYYRHTYQVVRHLPTWPNLPSARKAMYDYLSRSRGKNTEQGTYECEAECDGFDKNGPFQLVFDGASKYTLGAETGAAYGSTSFDIVNTAEVKKRPIVDEATLPVLREDVIISSQKSLSAISIYFGQVRQYPAHDDDDDTPLFRDGMGCATRLSATLMVQRASDGAIACIFKDQAPDTGDMGDHMGFGHSCFEFRGHCSSGSKENSYWRLTMGEACPTIVHEGGQWPPSAACFQLESDQSEDFEGFGDRTGVSADMMQTFFQQRCRWFA